MSNIILRVLKDIVVLLENQRLKYCLFGGLALQAYKRIRSTLDLDIILSLEPDKLQEFIEWMQRKNIVFDSSRGIKHINDFEFMRFLYTDQESTIDVPLDFVTVRTDFQKNILSRRRLLKVLGLNVYIASCEDLVLLKVLAGRPLDNVDAQVLIKENRKELDKSYLMKWAKILKIENTLKHLLSSEDKAI